MKFAVWRSVDVVLTGLLLLVSNGSRIVPDRRRAAGRRHLRRRPGCWQGIPLLPVKTQRIPLPNRLRRAILRRLPADVLVTIVRDVVEPRACAGRETGKNLRRHPWGSR